MKPSAPKQANPFYIKVGSTSEFSDELLCANSVMKNILGINGNLMISDDENNNEVF